MEQYILALDQGTTSTRAALVDHRGQIIKLAQREHQQIFPQAGWVEHDPLKILENTYAVIDEVMSTSNLTADRLAAVGMTNQRETIIGWDRHTGQPIYNAIVWQDTRTQVAVDALKDVYGEDLFRQRTGLPLSTYFSASKLGWILDHVPNARKRAERGELLFGTIDSWLLWNLSGGSAGGVHLSDVTNASRTQLFNLESLDWDEQLLEIFDIPGALLPRVVSSSEVYARAEQPESIHGAPLAGILGDQQAAAFGQAIFEPGSAKNTYGTGNFLLVNTGHEIIHSQHGLLSTVAFQLRDSPARYALEGSVAVTGALVQWLRDNLGLFESSEEIETLAKQVEDNGGVYIVPAFSGLFAPHWRPDARGVITGLTRFANKSHLARAALEATAFQTADLVTAFNQELPTPLSELRVDGGMVQNELLMQFQADILQIPVLRPGVTETSVLGAAFAAGLAVGYWQNTAEIASLWSEDRTFLSEMAEPERQKQLKNWQKALQRSLDWVTDS